MGVMAIEVFDADVVSEENLATQFYRLGDLGRKKVWALKDMVAEFSDETLMETYDWRVGASTRFNGNIIISAVDSISARKSIWEACINSPARWYLDARMGAEEFHLHVVNRRAPATVQWYEELLSGQTDENVAQEPCTRKATIYTASFAAALIGRVVKQISVGEAPKPHYVYNLKNDFLFV